MICYNTTMQVKINIDGGSRGNPGPGASAYVICDMQGKVLAQEGYFIPHCTNNQAEYTALKLALIKCAELGATELFIEGDSLLLVKQFIGEYKIKNPDLQARMHIIRTLAKQFTIHIKHVLREFNKAPDALANNAMDAKQTLGFNPINHLPTDQEILNTISTSAGNFVNGVAVTTVVRNDTTQKKTKKNLADNGPQQLSLFDE